MVFFYLAVNKLIKDKRQNIFMFDLLAEHTGFIKYTFSKQTLSLLIQLFLPRVAIIGFYMVMFKKTALKYLNKNKNCLWVIA